jgi:hypothetical protein
MKIAMYAIYPRDSADDVFLFRHERGGKLVVIDEYQDLVCQRCGKVNERAALARGVRPGVRIRSKRSFFPAPDHTYLMDERGKQVFVTLLPGQIDFYPIPSSGFYVASATTRRHPKDTDPGFQFEGGRCKVCGRAREICWGKESPILEEPKQFACINLEGWTGAREIWLVSKEVAGKLKTVSPPLTGMFLDPKEARVGPRRAP